MVHVPVRKIDSIPLQRRLYIDTNLFEKKFNHAFADGLESTRAWARARLHLTDYHGFCLLEAFGYMIYVPWNPAVGAMKSRTAKPLSVTIRNTDMYRLKQASRIMQELGLFRTIIDFDCLSERARNKSFSLLSIENFVREKGLQLFLGLSLATGLYGGLHLLAWNGPFRSRLVAIMWRVSGVIIASSGLTVPAIKLLIWGSTPYSSNIIGPILERRPAHLGVWPAWKAVFRLLRGLLYLTIPAYIFARTFLIIECLIQLAHLPPSTYEEVQWSRYFPHIL